MLKRHFTAHSLNTVVNFPSVYPWIKGKAEGHIDLAPLVANRNNVLLMGDHGGVMFIQHQPGLYEAHAQVLPAGLGKWATDMAHDAAKWMFTRTEAVELFARAPKGNLGARTLARTVGGQLEFRLDNGWVIDNKPVYADVFSLTIQNWIKTAPNLVEKGEWFQGRLNEEFKKHGRVVGKGNSVQNRHVGAAVEMIMAGQPEKGVIFFGRWATISGYPPIKIVTNNPLVIDTNSALIMVRDNDFWMVGCQS